MADAFKSLEIFIIKLLGRTKNVEVVKYRVFESFEDNAAQE